MSGWGLVDFYLEGVRVVEFLGRWMEFVVGCAAGLREGREMSSEIAAAPAVIGRSA